MRRSCRDLSHACGSLVLARKTLPRPYFPATFSWCGPASVRPATVLRYLRVAVRDDPSPLAPSTPCFGVRPGGNSTDDERFLSELAAAVVSVPAQRRTAPAGSQACRLRAAQGRTARRPNA